LAPVAGIFSSEGMSFENDGFSQNSYRVMTKTSTSSPLHSTLHNCGGNKNKMDEYTPVEYAYFPNTFFCNS
jgi:hypothetical protein